MSNPTPLLLPDPLEIDDARKASHELARRRRDAEGELAKAATRAADAEAKYRKELARAFASHAGGDKTAAQREADARAAVTDFSYERDLAASMLRVQTERLRGLEGERSMLKSLIDWSARIDPNWMAAAA